MERHQKADAVAFAEEFLLHPKGILNYDDYDLPTINVINKSLFEMVSRFGIKLNAIGTEENVREYVKKNFDRFSDCGGNPEFNNTTCERIIGDVERKLSRYSPGACKLDGIFLKQECWANGAEVAQHTMCEAFAKSERKYEDVSGILFHEYAHVIVEMSDVLKDGKKNSIFNFYITLSQKLSHNQSTIPTDNEIKLIYSEILGNCSQKSSRGLWCEIWAELFACYYVQSLHRKPCVLPQHVYTEIDQFMNSLWDRKRVGKSD